MGYHYMTAAADIFAFGTVPDGYFSDRAKVGFHFDKESGKVIVVTGNGCFNSGLPPVTSIQEALWIIAHHPTARDITISRVA